MGAKLVAGHCGRPSRLRYNPRDSSLPLQPGSRLGPYEILSLVGAGGMGEVYKARDTRLDRIVAVKIFVQNWLEEVKARVPVK